MIVYANEFFFPNCLEKHKLDKNRILMNTVNFLSSPNLITRFFISVVALVAAALCNAEPASSPSFSSQIHTIDSGCLTPRYDDHCERWVSVYDNPNGHSKVFSDDLSGLEQARAQVIGPQGDRVYVTGYSWDNTTQSPQWTTVAIDCNTGVQKWVARYGQAGITSYAYDIAVNPEGSRIYVVGQQYQLQQGQQFSEGVTIAYDSGTGRQLWKATYRLPFANASLEHVAVSPDGTKVYAAGTDTAGGDFGTGNLERYATFAYSASTGTQLWAASHDNPQLQNSVFSMAVDAKGGRVFVGGTGGIVAYETSTGRQLWERSDLSFSFNIAPDGSKLFTLRPRNGPGGTILSGQFDLVAYGTATGVQVWTYPMPQAFDATPPIVVDPGGERLYVATTQDATGPNDYFQNLDVVTMAFKTTSGTLLWSSRYDDSRFVPNEQDASGLAVSRDGKRLYLAARAARLSPSEQGAFDTSTVAYDAADGSQQWIGRYSVSPEDTDVPADPYPAAHLIGVTPDGTKVILSGSFNHHPSGLPSSLYPNNRMDYGVIAYDADVAPGIHAISAVSRKVHGAAGAFDLAGIECRSGGPNQRYQMVVTFPTPVTFRSAALTAGTGNVVSTHTSGAEVIVNLAGVANAQTIKLTLFGASDGTHINDVTVELSVLVGDVTASGSVSTSGRFSDIAEVQRQLGQAVTNASFRADVTVNGVIGNGDVSLVQSQSGTVLP